MAFCDDCEDEKDKCICDYKAQAARLFRAFLELSVCPYCEGIGDLCAEHVPSEPEEEDDCECCDDCGMGGNGAHCAHCSYLDE